MSIKEENLSHLKLCKSKIETAIEVLYKDTGLVVSEIGITRTFVDTILPLIHI